MNKNGYLPGEVRYADSGSSVDESKDGDDGEDQPPHPQDKEVLLVEEIVGQDAQVVGPVNATSSSTNSDVTGDLKTNNKKSAIFFTLLYTTNKIIFFGKTKIIINMVVWFMMRDSK